jgi:hypothetical protein
LVVALLKIRCGFGTWCWRCRKSSLPVPLPAGIDHPARRIHAFIHLVDVKVDDICLPAVIVQFVDLGIGLFQLLLIEVGYGCF